MIVSEQIQNDSKLKWQQINKLKIKNLVVSIGEMRKNPVKDYNFYVYILTNWNNKVMYVGMTNNLERRMYEHKNKLVDGFTKKYNVNKLVYYEQGMDAYAAIAREKEIKKWRREKKNKLVMTMNPEWKDLSWEWEVTARE